LNGVLEQLTPSVRVRCCVIGDRSFQFGQLFAAIGAQPFKMEEVRFCARNITKLQIHLTLIFQCAFVIWIDVECLLIGGRRQLEIAFFAKRKT
jgi:hypothetical protein